MDSQQIYETSHMISSENLDIRTITMGISLLDCIDSDSDRACKKIYDKITTKAKELVKVGQQIETEYGIPIANKRITVTPISLIAAASGDHDYVKYAKTLDRAARTLGVDFIGGFSALVQKGFQNGDRVLIDSLPQSLAETNYVCASVNVGSTSVDNFVCPIPTICICSGILICCSFKYFIAPIAMKSVAQNTASMYLYSSHNFFIVSYPDSIEKSLSIMSCSSTTL